jgi:intracellular protein transport protein USO1
MLTNVPEAIRSLSLYTVADLIRSHEVNQTKLSECAIKLSLRPEHSGIPNQKLPPGVLTSAIKAIVQTALGKDKYSIRFAACYVFQCYVYNNPEAQLALATTLSQPPSDVSNTPQQSSPSLPGSLLVGALLDLDSAHRDPYRNWLAANMLTHIIHDNPKSKQYVLSINLNQEEGMQI